MELVTGGELFDRILDRGSYSEQDAALLIKEVVEACDYLHTIGVIHRDLKPENLLFKTDAADSKIMISDFGLSKVRDNSCFHTKPGAGNYPDGWVPQNSQHISTACGTPGYVAPEVLLREPQNEKVDLWAIGVITYILLCGYPPFYSEDDQQLFQQIIRGKFAYENPYWTDISPAAKNFVSSLLTKDPAKRFSCKEALKHEWLTGKAYNVDIKQRVQEKLRHSISRNRWRKAYNATLVMQKLTKASETFFEIEGPKEHALL